eukprot:CAMPEP_0202688500 /NCGR_PEP_ID=MMETSP1385-20130828/4001_1 /ASSEMBLY_ACC=CAM_ASM_000861 /TAXON_ID=933848 /ORGANISM="Elphidium margaritaceum" /LENGTH=740 /DNA_ID=CAMNT_0049343493 /DNA_START=129 /DNA_END=2348 /DNA_ORIENTATION=+
MSEGSYFVDHKRGEIMELRANLQNRKLDKDPKAKRDVIKKVIAYMTLGIDVSSLFSQMIMATITTDLVQKKMVYLYLCTYAASKPDLTLLAVNTLQRDCRDDDPMIRGLALRSLCSLRVGNLTEYVMDPIRVGLTDTSAYVRKTAVMGVAKLFSVAPSILKDSDLVDILYNIIKDKDTLVVVNAIHALNEILAEEGGMAVNTKIIHHLLNRMHTFNEWGQMCVLELVSRYRPTGSKSTEEIYDIMNLLEDRLRHSNSALVLATAKVFLKLTAKLPNVNREVYKRIKTPLLTLISNPNHAIAYPVVCHVQLLITKNADIFADSYKHFFCRYNDPICVKEIKVKCLANLVNDHNAQDILSELSEYTTDVDVEIARLAIRSIGKIAVECESAMEQSIYHLLTFLDMQQDYIISETAVCIKMMLRKYPDQYEDVLDKLKHIMKNVEETDGKCAILWILGEYGEQLLEAPYILEQYIDAYDEEQSSEVKLELLSAAMKLFFKRAPEMQKMLGRLLKSAVLDTTKVDVRDRGVFYYKLLQFDVDKAAQIVNCPQISINSFFDPTEHDLTDKIFNEFNTLSVIYRRPAELFISEEPVEASDNEREDAEQEQERDEEDAIDGDDDHDDDDQKNDGREPEAAAAPDEDVNGGIGMQPPQQEVDILGIGGGGGGVGAAAGAGDVEFSHIVLNANPQCTRQAFQKLWKGTKDRVEQTQKMLRADNVAQSLEELANTANFKTMASNKKGRKW